MPPTIQLLWRKWLQIDCALIFVHPRHTNSERQDLGQEADRIHLRVRSADETLNRFRSRFLGSVQCHFSFAQNHHGRAALA